jgi:hypothetical protein
MRLWEYIKIAATGWLLLLAFMAMTTLVAIPIVEAMEYLGCAGGESTYGIGWIAAIVIVLWAGAKFVI